VLAGHPPPLVIGAQAIPLDAEPGLPLGVSPDADYSVVSIDLADTRGLLFYTDGLVEGRAQPGSTERYGIDRLARRVTQVAGTGALDGDVLRIILAETETANGGRFFDDVTILLVTARLTAAGKGRAAGAVGRSTSATDDP
jgi:serine phosphatase RsbU (regulator of sigma subunit)